jgi:micrococcal nuclease
MPAQAESAPGPVSIVEGLVVGVSEGDRITLNCLGTEIKVQLYGLAAPLTMKMDKYTGWYKTGQPYADDAFRALSSKILHQMVRAEIRSTLVHKRSESQRLSVAVVYLDGRNINLEMLSEGWAWVYRKYMHKSDIPQYLSVERAARARKNGLWVQDDPQPPWHFQPKLRAATGSRPGSVTVRPY